VLVLALHRQYLLIDWLAETAAPRWRSDFDMDTIDSNEIVLGLGAELDGLTIAQARRVVPDPHSRCDVGLKATVVAS
jgi:arginase